MLFNTVVLSLFAISVSTVFAAPLPSFEDETTALAARDIAGADLDEMPFEKRSLFERDLADEGLELYIRGLEADSENDLLAREMIDEEMERRSFFGKIGKAFKKVASFVLKRDVAEPEPELERRSFFGKIGKAFKKVASFVLKRDVAEPEPELERRSFFGKIGKAFKKVASFVLKRDVAEPEPELERRSFFGKIGKAFKKVASFVLRRDESSAPVEELTRRDVEPEAELELLERDVEEADLFERDFDEFEVYERDFDDSEVFERDFEPEYETELLERSRAN